jgi:hypothetical protein
MPAVAADRVHYAAHFEVLEPDHPERRFVTALCLYSHAVDTGQAGLGFYDHEDAERFARALPMPAEEFISVNGKSDTELAELFAAPLEQTTCCSLTAQLGVVALSGAQPCVRIGRESWSLTFISPVGTSTGSWGLTILGAIRCDPSAAIPRARHAS